MALFPSPPEEYAQLVARVDAFFSDVASRCASAMACQPGCDGCCQVQLTLSPVESASVSAYVEQLDADSRAVLRKQLEAQPETASPRCSMIDGNGQCLIYPARPLVCRSQGLPLRYPPELVPIEAVRARVPSGVVTVCPLNFTAQTPRPSDALDAERVDQILALLNHRYVAIYGLDGQSRYGLADVVGAALEP